MSEYPKRLLPQSCYSLIAQESLLSQRDLWLIRHIDSGKVKFIEGTSTLDPDCITIQSDQLRDLSNNLLGIFLIKDSFWGIEKEYGPIYCNLWDGKENCDPPKEGEYFNDTKRGYYFIPVDLLLSSKIQRINTESNTTEEFHFNILHTPTKCNFWHISVRVYNSKDEEISKLAINDKQKRKIWKTVRDFLVSAIIKIDPPKDYAIINKEIYTKLA